MDYSIDKIKIKIDLVALNDIQKLLNSLSLSQYVAYHYSSNKMTDCKYNFVMNWTEGVTFYVGIAPNSDFYTGKENKNYRSVVIEYNPNKCKAFALPELKFLLFTNRCTWRIMSVDFAIDMYDYKYSDIVMMKRDKREYFATLGHSTIETRYLGDTRSRNGRCKLYDKAIEQKMVNTLWSRFEITIKGIEVNNSFEEFCKCFKLPDLYVADSLGIDGINGIVFRAICSDINELYNISNYNTRKKYEKMLSTNLKSINVDKNLIFDCFKKYFVDLDFLKLVDLV